EDVGGVDARVVELDALADAVRPRAQDDDPRSLSRPNLGLLLVRGVVIRGQGRELPRASVDGLEHRQDAKAAPRRADLAFDGTGAPPYAPVGQPDPLRGPHLLPGPRIEIAVPDRRRVL